MKVIFIRHGHTPWNARRKIQGSTDIALSDQGVVEAQQLAKHLLDGRYYPEHIYSSSLSRAAETARIIGECLNVPVTFDDALREINFGEWEGLTWKQAKESYEYHYALWHSNRRFTQSPNGESYQDLLERVLPMLERVLSIHTQDVYVVTHSAVILSILCLYKDVPFEKLTSFAVHNCDTVALDADRIRTIIAREYQFMEEVCYG